MWPVRLIQSADFARLEVRCPPQSQEALPWATRSSRASGGCRLRACER
ncbi:hypothetical protein HMPREF3150_04177 [Pseudomonas aeruginosa]|nr:hypothetical protein HMPREF3150_04177 [Pseudomonas aeruginosa]